VTSYLHKSDKALKNLRKLKKLSKLKRKKSMLLLSRRPWTMPLALDSNEIINITFIFKKD